MKDTPPVIPEWINQLRGKAAQFNGAWIFTDSEHRKRYNAQKFILAPRAGIAIRVNDRTAIQAGFARFIVPSVTQANQTVAAASIPGFSVQTSVLPSIEGVPAAVLSNPFPAGKNPLQPVVGKSLGRYTNLGNSNVGWSVQDFKNTVNDRFTFTLQRELPGGFKADVTWFMHFARNVMYLWDWPFGEGSRLLNMADPNLTYTHKGKVYEGVENPFYNYQTPDKFPGQLRNRKTVSVIDLLRPYPQYGALWQTNTTGLTQHYKSLQMKVQRSYANGVSLLWAYNYHRQSLTYFLTDLDQYANKPVWRGEEV